LGWLVEHAAQRAVREALQRERALAQLGLRRLAGAGELVGDVLAGVAQLGGDVGDADVCAVGVTVGGGERCGEAERFGLGEGPVEHRAGDRLEQAFAHLTATQPGQRVQPCGPAGGEGEDLPAERSGERGVFAFGVDQLAGAAEHAAAVHPALDQRALAVAGAADHEHVRVVEHPGRVEDPGVVDERAAVDVTADVDAAGAETWFGDGGVGGLEVSGRDLVGTALTRAAQTREPPRLGLGVFARWRTCVAGRAARRRPLAGRGAPSIRSRSIIAVPVRAGASR
jgi:hypothetical protein